MNANLRLLSVKARGRPEPHRMKPTGSTWTDPVGRECLLDHIRLAELLREATGTPWSFESAVVDVYLDTDRGGERRPKSGKSGYSARWGWGRTQVRERWNDIEAAVRDWRSAFGRLRDRDHSVATQQPRDNHEIEDSGENSQSHNHAVTTEQPHPDHADIYREENGTNTNTNSQPETPCSPPEGDGEGEDEKAPRVTDAQLEEIYLAFPRLIGKVKAKAAIKTALKKKGAPTAAEMLDIVRTYASAVAEWTPDRRRYIPYPATWFNQGRYFDDPAEWQPDESSETAPIDHSRYLSLSERDRKGYRPIHRDGTLSWVPSAAPTPTGYQNGRPAAPNQTKGNRP